MGRVEAPFVVDLCSLIQHCAPESLKEALCMSVWPFSLGHMSIFIICMQACFEGFVDCLCLIRCDIAIHKDVPASDSLCVILPINDACNYVHHLNY